ncbi:hypothetical protein [Andreprevotia chitinilytica]|uniref:hypothetical protein n=1 Tax=Andreprevotia chitinilytica TaxID=396808 RepID=UPI000557DC93|nr:hypothetical protein [Andreprevotia chitinilytica]
MAIKKWPCFAGPFLYCVICLTGLSYKRRNSVLNPLSTETKADHPFEDARIALAQFQDSFERNNLQNLFNTLSEHANLVQITDGEACAADSESNPLLGPEAIAAIHGVAWEAAKESTLQSAVEQVLIFTSKKPRLFGAFCW